MKIKLEILSASSICAKQEIEDLHTKILVPKMVTRRRLTRAAKMAIYLADHVSFTQGKIIYGSSFGELPATANILHAIQKEEGISPTHFQNSVYNTAVSYLSMLHENKEEILTVSSGDNTSEKVLKAGAIKALEGGTFLLLVTETLNIDAIDEVNTCHAHLESGAALKVRLSTETPTIDIKTLPVDKHLPASVQLLYALASTIKTTQKNIIEVAL